MMKKQMVRDGYVVLRNGFPQGMDHASGGYPFDANHPRDVYFHGTPQDASKYTDTMNGHGKSTEYQYVYATVTLEY